MKLAKISELLGGLLDPERGRVAKRDSEINELLDRLRNKEAKFAARLSTAKAGKETEKLERQIKVCQAQITKGMDALATAKP